ncbi:MAG: glycoside hydrolase family 5 protein [Lachnospiraceae bacterium]|nr:glycoside hydrolase family 5 protein [Ruminococcus sp.]MCM1274653.1 glycoside hydrolase family 5 protein [Lachnospiraceae bacterium]
MKTIIKKLGAITAALMIALCAGCSSDKNNSSDGSSGANVSDSGSQSGGSQDSGSSSADESSASESGSSAPEAPPADSNPEEWHELSQTEMTAAMGAGWNLGNQLEAVSGQTPDEKAWSNPVITEELLKLVKEQGFKTVRIPVSYFAHIGEGPDYTINKDWLNRVREVVDYVIGNDMYAIINIHGDGYYTMLESGAWLLCAEPAEKQAEIKAKYEAVWRQIADCFKDYDEHLIFESMNEEFDGQYGGPNAEAYANINAYNQIFVDTVRKTGSNNTKRWLLVPGWNTNIMQTVGDYGFEIPNDTLCEADGKRIMISVHYYDPYNFTINEDANAAKTQWGQYAVENAEKTANEAYVSTLFGRLNEKFVSQGYPVVIGEMGVGDKSSLDPSHSEFRRYWYEVVVSAAKQNGCIPVCWDNGWTGKNGLSFFNRWNLTVTQPEIIEGVMRAINADGEYEIPAPVIAEGEENAA